MKWNNCTVKPEKESYFDGTNLDDDRLLKLHWDGENWFVLYVGAEVKIPENEVRNYQYLISESPEPAPSNTGAMGLIPGNEPIALSRPQKELIPEKTMNELKHLAEITGCDMDGIIAGWWVRCGEVQTLQLELDHARNMAALTGEPLESNTGYTGADVPGEEGVEEAAQAYADKVCPFVWPTNKEGEKIVQRVGQKAPGSGKHRRQQEVIKAAYIAGASHNAKGGDFAKVLQNEVDSIKATNLLNDGQRAAVVLAFNSMIELYNSGIWQSPASLQPGIVEQLREENPLNGALPGGIKEWKIWDHCCDTLARIIDGEHKPDILQKVQQIRDELNEAVPTGKIEAFELIKIISAHIRKLDTITDLSNHLFEDSKPLPEKHQDILNKTFSSLLSDKPTKLDGEGEKGKEDEHPAFKPFPPGATDPEHLDQMGNDPL